MTRTHGKAPKGERVIERVPRQRGKVTTLLGAISLSGEIASLTVEGGTSGDVFLAYVEQILIPTLTAGAVVVMDNLRAHYDTRVIEALEKAGAKILYLPAYSPDLNPIEMCWSKVKSYLKAAKARTVEELRMAIGRALASISRSDIAAWFRHCGYRDQPV